MYIIFLIFTIDYIFIQATSYPACPFSEVQANLEFEMWNMLLSIASASKSSLCYGLQGVFRHLLMLEPNMSKEVVSINVWNKSRKVVSSSAPLWLSFQEEIVRMISENIGKMKYIFELTLKMDWMTNYIRQKLSGRL